MKHSPEGDLKHYLKLSLAQIQHHIKEAGASSQADPSRPALSTIQLRLLEELIKEQMPNENSNSSAR